MQKDVKLIEGVQRRALKLIDGFNLLCYEDRLKLVNLTTLETRRIRGDLIEVYKILHGYTDINPQDFFTFSGFQFRGHGLKLYKPRIRTDIGKFSFSYRIVDIWNALPGEIVSSDSINTFKNMIDRVLRYDWGLT